MAWVIKSKELLEKKMKVQESIFSLANGYIGVRGNFEEEYYEGVKTVRDSYMNGFYEISDLSYGEGAHGFPQTQQKSMPIVDAQTIYIYLDGEKVNLFNYRHISYHRKLFLEKGITVRGFKYKTRKNKVATIEFRRLVSLVHKELFLIDVSITFDGKIKVESILRNDINDSSQADAKDPRSGNPNKDALGVKEISVKRDEMTIVNVTERSFIEVSCVCKHNIYTEYIEKYSETVDTHTLMTTIEGKGKMQFTKYAVYTDTLRYENPLDEGRNLMKAYIKKDFRAYKKSQKEYLNKFWKISDIIIEGDDEIQRSIRFCIFQLLQSAGRDSFSNIPAKGLSGIGYEGHYFWDTEIYMLPFFQMTNPEIAKNLLLYRYRTMNEAKQEAEALGHEKGIKFPWRTISGAECSGFFPAGQAQYHINGDIAYSYVQYYLYNKDNDFMADYGAELLIETARIWLDIGNYHKGTFRINCVTGPDEYTAIVNNNYYTNCMAKHNLQWAANIYHLLLDEMPEKLEKLKKKIHLYDGEIIEMEEAAQKMFLPYNNELNISLQDSDFEQKKPWDFERISESKYPLLLNYHPLTIYRYKVLKQPDVVLAHFLLENYASDEIIKDSYDYYEKITTHDSSLSYCVHGIMASKIGYSEKAYEYFLKTVRMDLDDLNKNTADGLHLASIGGSWLSIVYGFGGVRIKSKGIELSPVKPSHWRSYSFKILYHDSLIHIEYEDKIKIELIEGEPIIMKVYGMQYVIDGVVEINPKEIIPIDKTSESEGTKRC